MPTESNQTGADLFLGRPAFPDAEESITECLKLGLLRMDAAGNIVAGVPQKPLRVHWGECEMILLVRALWPDIPKAGVPFVKLLERAKIAGELYATSIQSKVD